MTRIRLEALFVLVVATAALVPLSQLDSAPGAAPTAVAAAAAPAPVITFANGPLPPGGTFTDDDGNFHEGSIEAIAAEGITNGCNAEGTRYCPSGTVTRGQMAAFINRSLPLEPAGADYFSDDDGSIFEDDINRIAEAGITRGCDAEGTRFCPDREVTRGEMAALIVRGFGFTEGLGDDTFVDDDDSIFEDDIDRLARAGVTNGCNPQGDWFCPDDPVLRDAMASFLARALGLDPIVPPDRCPVLPADNIWNTRIDGLPVHARSADYIASIGGDDTLHPDFGSGVWPPESMSPIGIPYIAVGDAQADRTIEYTAYGDESDPGPFPIPLDAPVEGGPLGTGDRHVIAVDVDACVLYELFAAFPLEPATWQAASGARYDLRSNALRPAGWTSADAAGLPIFPGLVRYDEVEAGAINHAIRFTASRTQRAYVWPARHFASTITDPSVPPMGQRFRLKAGYDISGFSPEVRVILTAMKQYGLILADNGADWFVSGAPDERWDNDMLRELKDVPGSAFEAVDVSSLMVDPDSGKAGG